MLIILSHLGFNCKYVRGVVEETSPLYVLGRRPLEAASVAHERGAEARKVGSSTTRALTTNPTKGCRSAKDPYNKTYIQRHILTTPYKHRIGHIYRHIIKKHTVQQWRHIEQNNKQSTTIQSTTNIRTIKIIKLYKNTTQRSYNIDTIKDYNYKGREDTTTTRARH